MPSRLLLVTFLFTCFTALATRGAEAALLLSFQQGVNGYAGTQDVMIISHHPDTSDDTFWLGNDIADNEPTHFVQPLLRFDDIIGMNSGQIAPGSTVKQATLTLTIFNGGSGIFVHQLYESWDESSTWNSMLGGADQRNPLYDSGLGVQSHTKFVPEKALDFDVTPSLRAWVEDGQPNYGWVLLAPWPNGTDSVGIWSSEYSNASLRPQLTVEFEPVPEPGSLAIWGLAGLGILAFGRRRHQRPRA